MPRVCCLTLCIHGQIIAKVHLKQCKASTADLMRPICVCLSVQHMYRQLEMQGTYCE